MDSNEAIIVVYAALFLAICLYAVVLDHIHDRYVPDYVWLTVVIGEGMIMLAYAALELLSVNFTFFLIFLGQAVAGTPIVVWQLIQHGRRAGGRANNGGEDESHAAKDTRRERRT